MREPSRKVRLASGGLLLALTLGWAAYSGFRFAETATGERILSSHSFIGEILTHRILARASLVSYRMPLATVVSAKIHYHAPVRYGLLLAANLVLVVLLVFALGSLLQTYGAAVSALAVVSLMRLTPDFNVYPESGYYLLVLLSAGLLVWRARAPSPARSAWLAAALGASLIWRSPLAFFAPALGLYEWAVEHRFAKSYRKQLLILVLGPGLFLLPWIGMNLLVHGRFVPFEYNAANSNIVTGALGLVQNIEGDLSAIVDGPVDVKNPGAVFRWAVGETLRHPVRFARAYVLRARYALAFHPWLALLGLAGFWIFRTRREYRHLALLAAYFLAIHCFMTVEERYFWPLWPLLALLACSLPLAARAGEAPRTNTPEYRLAERALKGATALAVLLSLYASGVILRFGVEARGERGDAEEQLDAALRSNPDDAWLFAERGKERFARGDVAAASADLARAAELEPSNPASSLQLARVEALAGRPERLLAWTYPSNQGHEELQLVYDSDILKACALLRLGRTAEARARLVSARAAFGDRNVVVRGPQGEREKEILGKLRTSDTGFITHCRQLQGPRPYAEQAALYELLAELVPDSSELWMLRGAAAAAAGRHAEALRALARAERLKPAAASRLALVLDRAEISLRAGDRAGARAALAEAAGLAPEDDESRLRLVNLYRELGEPGLAAEALAAMSLKSPRDAGLYVERAELAAQAGAREEAAKYLETALSLDPDARRRLRLVVVALELRDLRRARELSDASIRDLPGESGVWLARAELLLETGDRAGALSSLSRGEALPLSEDQRRRVVVLHRKLGDAVRARDMLDALIVRAPRDAGLRLESAELAALSGDRRAALAALSQAEERVPDHPEQIRRIAALYESLKEDRRAAAFLDSALRRRPGDSGLWLARAKLAGKAGERAVELKALSRAEALGVSGLSVDLLLERARAATRSEALRILDAANARPVEEAGQRGRILEMYRRLREPGRARAFLESQLKFRPGSVALRLERAELDAEAGDRAAALRSLDRAEALHPSDAERLRLALSLANLREDARARAMMDSVSGRIAWDSRVWLARAGIDARAGDRAAALKALAKADPGRETALAYQDLKEYDRALAVFSGLVRLHPEEASYLSDQALCEHLMGNSEAAISDLRRALALQPKFLPAALTLGAVLSSKGREAEALAVYREALAKSPAAENDPLRPLLLKLAR